MLTAVTEQQYENPLLDLLTSDSVTREDAAEILGDTDAAATTMRQALAQEEAVVDEADPVAATGESRNEESAVLPPPSTRFTAVNQQEVEQPSRKRSASP